MNNTTEKEVWKDIYGFECLYQISNLGNVKRLESKIWAEKTKHKKGHWVTRKEKLLKPWIDTGGYNQVKLYKDKNNHETFKVHRLVAGEFINNPNNSPYVNHKDEIKTNNRADNLEWCTMGYNNNYGSRTKKATESNSGINGANSKLNKRDIFEIYGLFLEGYKQTKIAQKYGVSMCTINALLKGRTYIKELNEVKNEYHGIANRCFQQKR